MRVRRVFGACVAVSALLIAACGDNSGDIAQTGTTVPTTAGETTTSATPTTVSSATQLNVSGKEYSYDTGGTTSVPAGAVDIHFTNDGTVEHQATLIKLHDGVTLPDFAAAGASDPSGRAALALADAYGGPNSTAPGDTQTASADVTPGNYLLICFIPASDGLPHAAKGMIMPITVTPGPTSSAAPPAGDGTLVTKDFGFGVPSGFTGKGTYAIDQQGPQSHEIAVYKLDNGKTFADAQAFLGEATPTGPPPFTPSGGISALAPDGPATVTLDLSPGSYVFVCFLPDATDGKPHFTHGMIQQVNIS